MALAWMSFGGLALGYGDYPVRINLLGSVYGRRGGAGRRWGDVESAARIGADELRDFFFASDPEFLPV